jgi:hypothetical protein
MKYSYANFFLVILLILVCDCTKKIHSNIQSDNIKQSEINYDQDISQASMADNVLDDKFGQLRVGMSKLDVIKILGYPLNKIDDDVWLWDKNKKISEDKEWKEIYGSMNSGKFLLFSDGKLLQLPRGISTDYTHYVYAHAKKIEIEQVPERYIYRIDGVIQE